MFYQFYQEKQADHKPVVFVVLDLDETLVYYKGEKQIMPGKRTCADVEVRPGIDIFFAELNKQGFKIILFTLGSAQYLNHILKVYLHSIKKYVILFLSWKHAEISFKAYHKHKHSKYVVSKIKSKGILIGVDDQAFTNMDAEGYTKLYKIKPFKGGKKDTCLFEVLEDIKNLYVF